MDILPDFIHLFFRQFLTDFEDGLAVSSVKTAVVVVQNNDIEMYKKECCTCNYILLIKPTDFLAVFVAVAK